MRLSYEEISRRQVDLDSTTNAVGNTTINVDEGSDFNVGDIIAVLNNCDTNDFDDGDFYRITVISSEQLTFVQHLEVMAD